MSVSPLSLFLTFAKIGLFTFGGGYAMIPLIQREAAEKKGWVTQEDLLDVVAIAESTPGPIAINAATFIGRKTAGVPGAVCATLGVVLPSFAIITALSFALQAFSGLKPVQYAFFGIRAGVMALILRALWTLFRACDRNAFTFALMAAAFILVCVLKLSSILVIVICAVLGIVRAQTRKVKT